MSCYRYIEELDECFRPLYHDAADDSAAIAAAVKHVRGVPGLRVHIRRNGRYLAEVATDWTGHSVIVERWHSDGSTTEQELS